MAHKIGDRIKEQASTSGTGAFTLAGALAGFEAFASALTADGDTTWYCAVNGAEWEIGLGTRTATGVLARTTVLNSSNADALVNFSAPPVVFCTVPGSQIATHGPIFSAAQNAAQSLPATTPTKLNFSIEEFDSNGAFANGRFQPAVSGYYDLNGAVSYASAVATNSFVSIYKNGVEARRGVQMQASHYTLTVAAKIYLNGTTDYVELWAYVGTAVSTTGSPLCNFQGAFLRPA